MDEATKRRLVWVRWAAAGAILLSVLLMMRVLPLAEIDHGIRAWIGGMGPWAPLVFLLIYVVWALLLLPASLLTLLAGAVWGLWWGALFVMIGATVSVALSFLIARYAARDQMSRLARQSRRFRAVDEAITEGGWKVVALIRLTPMFPFGIQNYAYGLTGIGFWPALAASIVCMLPGTLMFVYLGHLTRVGAAAAIEDGPSLWVWALRGLGLIAGVGVIVYVGRLARRKLREVAHEAHLHQHPDEPEESMEDDDFESPRLPWRTAALAGAAALLLGGAIYAQANTQLVRGLVTSMFGPPAVMAVEAYERRPDGPVVDHARLDRVLAAITTADGRVDYQKLLDDPALTDALDAYLAQLAAMKDAELEALGRNEMLALLINAYNAATLRLILDHWPLASIRDIPEPHRWKAPRWRIGPHELSLDEIEHTWIRPRFVEPRIHFAINCASVGCPPMRPEAYTGARIDEQLEDQMRLTHVGGTRWFTYDAEAGVIHLSRLYEWFAGDFEAVVGSVPAWLARYDEQLRTALDADQSPRLAWIEYDWSLNAPGARD